MTKFAVDPSVPRGERFDGWGYTDSGLDLENNGVKLIGARYEMSGKRLPNLLTWANGILKTELVLQPEFEVHDLSAISPARELPAFIAALGSIGYTQEDNARRRHGHGHSLEEVHAIRHGRLTRVPDIILYPVSETQVQTLVQLAKEHHVLLVPFGGGSNVSHALACPPNDPRPIASVDMRRMNKIISIDKENRVAHIEAGIVGSDLQAELEKHGFTIGHEPDSNEFSTLGGWIATRSSGMKKNRYGNIEDIVLDIRMVTAQGLIEGRAMPRESMGTDPRTLAFGSEGNFGIITSAFVKIFALPEVHQFDSVLFKNFADGYEFMRELAKYPPYPASARLMDNLQFQFGQALKPETLGWKATKSKLERALVTGPLGFDPNSMCACTLLYEGSKQETALQSARVGQLARQFRGFRAGGENGKRGYQLTFAIAYIRDFFMRFGVMAESFETSVSWTDLPAMCEAVKTRVLAEHKRLGLPGYPMISWRVTQLYHTGAAVYFYLATLATGVKNPAEQFAILEHTARETILEHGGSISHHHGIGKLRAGFVKDVKSRAGLDWIKGAKEHLDPENIFGIGNQ
jgi:alkyldihydroxyacetonephosphate synthase